MPNNSTWAVVSIAMHFYFTATARGEAKCCMDYLNHAPCTVIVCTALPSMLLCEARMGLYLHVHVSCVTDMLTIIRSGFHLSEGAVQSFQQKLGVTK